MLYIPSNVIILLMFMCNLYLYLSVLVGAISLPLVNFLMCFIRFFYNDYDYIYKYFQYVEELMKLSKMILPLFHHSIPK